MMSKAFSNAEITEHLAKLLKWHFADGTIRRTWQTHGWKATLMAVNAVGHLAELAFHHPEIIANYGSVEVRLNTHDANGITDKDFALAAKIDQSLDWRPASESGPLDGAPASDKAAAYFKD